MWYETMWDKYVPGFIPFFCPDGKPCLVSEKNYGEMVKEHTFVISRTCVSEEGER